ncbi:MAG: type II toxin-antitoxin system death-on-curing family toxin [Candidatus Micrarchaeota archaeon]
MAGKIKHLSLGQVADIHDKIIDEFGNAKGILDEANLQFALSRAEKYSGREDVLFWKTAIILELIVKGHPFVDGNKRTGFESCKTFLDMNHYMLEAPDDEIINFLLNVAKNKLNRHEIKKWLKLHARKQI